MFPKRSIVTSQLSRPALCHSSGSRSLAWQTDRGTTRALIVPLEGCHSLHASRRLFARFPSGLRAARDGCHGRNSLVSQLGSEPRVCVTPPACVLVCVREPLWPLAQRWMWRLACSVAARFVVRQTDVPRTTEWLKNSPLSRWTGCCSGETHFYKVFFVNVVLSFCFFLFWGF